MAVLNITYNGVSFDCPQHVDERVTDIVPIELLTAFAAAPYS